MGSGLVLALVNCKNLRDRDKTAETKRVSITAIDADSFIGLLTNIPRPPSFCSTAIGSSFFFSYISLCSSLLQRFNVVFACQIICDNSLIRFMDRDKTNGGFEIARESDREISSDEDVVEKAAESSRWFGHDEARGCHPVRTTSGVYRDERTVLLEPYEHIANIPGKNVRSKLIDAFNVWLQVPEEKLRVVKEVVAMLHNASLLIDDIEDSSTLRRGIPAAHTIYGLPMTINAANYVYFEAMKKTQEMGSVRALEVFIEELMNLHNGQGLDIYWRENLICPTEAEYRRMVIDKTGGLFRLAVSLMQEFSSNNSNFVPVTNALGLYYQILDDLLNLKSVEYHHNKSFCEDLSEGKFSFPIIHAITSQPEDVRLLSILKQKTQSIELKTYARDLMEKAGSFRYTAECLEKMLVTVRAEASKIGPNPALGKLLDSLSKKHSYQVL